MTDSSSKPTLLQGGTVVSSTGVARADVRILGEKITHVGNLRPEVNDSVIECAGRYILPGFIDTHAHVDGAIFDPHVQLALLRQGITTAITGQDGVSYAPGDGSYATEYFAAINGPHPTYRGGGVQELLGTYERQTPINIGYLLPASTLRYEAMGQAQREPTPSELGLMREWVIQGMAEGALGISTGLDYIPGIFASAQEIAALCAPVAEAGGLYVTHMRGGYEANSEEGVDEVIRIAQEAGVAAHISHFHAEPHIVKSLLQTARSQGVDITFDAYPYTRGCTLVSMAILPPELINQPTDEVVGVLTDPEQREHLRHTWFPQVEHNPSLGPNWPEMIVLGHVPHPDFAWAHGKTLAEGASENGQEIIDFTLDLLAACRLEVNAVMSVRYMRDVHDLGAIFQDAGHMGGSDGIFIGQHPHPRGYGSFGRYLHQFVTSHNYWTWSQAVDHLSHNPARRFKLGLRGQVKPGWVADLIVVEAEARDQATYDAPTRLATGIDDVFVAGEHVLSGGQLTGNTPGRGLKRGREEPL